MGEVTLGMGEGLGQPGGWGLGQEFRQETIKLKSLEPPSG